MNGRPTLYQHSVEGKRHSRTDYWRRESNLLSKDKGCRAL